MPKMYKVCAVDEAGDFRSSNYSMRGSATPTEVLLTYTLGVKQEAPIGGLLCFTNFESAESFKKCNYFGDTKYVILRGSAEDEVILPAARVYPESSIGAFKAAWNGTLDWSFPPIWPECTRAYKYFTPEEIVLDGR
jgi:hypothetical protein